MKEAYSILFLLSIIIEEIYSSSLPTCTEKNINSKITQCENNKQKILIYLYPECTMKNEGSKLIQSSLQEVNCTECQDGYYLSYNFPQQKMECLMCPKNTYSIKGNFRIKGSYYEWTSDNLALFKNECFIKSQKKEYSNCSGMTNQQKHFIQSGNSFNPNLFDYTYIAQLSKTFRLVERGYLKFTYKKDTVKQGLGKNGVFRLYINYQIEINDYDLNNDLKEVSIPLEPGTYTLLWQYIKSVLFETKVMALTIESISLTGLDSAARECIPCSTGISEPGSDHCSQCTGNNYFDKATGQCLDCPKGTYNPSSDECIPIQSCTEVDYKYIYSNQCNYKTNKMSVRSETNNPSCKTGDFEIECNDCLPGQYIKKIDSNYYECEYCPFRSYSEGVNFLNCKKCDGIAKRSTYYYPNNSYYFEHHNIETIDGDGYLYIYFNEELDSQNAEWLETSIDSINSKLAVTGNLTFNLTEGIHSIKLKSINVKINYIKVSHTTTGGGYKCMLSSDPDNSTEGLDETEGIQCHSGFEYNTTSKECQECQMNSYKSLVDNKCHQCPPLTLANEKKSNCIPHEVANQNNYKLKLNIGNLILTQQNICMLTGSLCNLNFYGPIRDNRHNMFFLSYFSANTFHSNDLTYKFNNKTSKTPSFIYMLQSNEDGSQSNTKTVSNIGKHIDYVKFVKGNSSRGLITHYINGDMCKEDKTKKYETYLYLNCTKDDDEVLTFHFPRYINREGCRFYFEWSSKEACPICRRSEVTAIEMPCRLTERKVYYTEGPNCIISNTTNTIGNDMEYTDENLMITNKDVDLIKQFRLSDINQEQGKEDKDNKPNGINGTEDNNTVIEDYYILNKQVSEVCFLMSDADSITSYILIAIPIVYGIIVLICVIICLKYRKIKGNYHMLVETPDSKNVTEDKIHPQLEILSSHPNEIIIGESVQKEHEENSIEVKIKQESVQSEKK